METKLIDYTKRKKENPQKNILKCPLCDKIGRMVEVNSEYVRFIHTEKIIFHTTIPVETHNVPRIFLEQYKELRSKSGQGKDEKNV